MNCELRTVNYELRKTMRSRHAQSGFTLVELMIVIAIISILLLLAVPRFTAALVRARESALREDLQTMRMAIDSYTMDKQKAPQSLDDLIQDGYLRAIPEDPITRSKDTWVTDTSDAMSSVDQTEPGIVDVHSGSDEIGTDQQPYSSW
jgi:general secretion pathway protein G